MTVKELIDVLQKMPQDVDVVYNCFSDVAALEAEHIECVLASDEKIIKKDGRFCEYYRHWFPGLDMTESFVTVVRFPGN